MGEIIMNRQDLIEFLALLDKLSVVKNDRLTKEEKEFCKCCIDELKKSAKQSG